MRFPSGLGEPMVLFKRIIKGKTMFKRIKLYFQAGVPVKRAGIIQKPTIEGLCRRYARGNVRLQMGRVMTSAKYESQKKNVLSHEF